MADQRLYSGLPLELHERVRQAARVAYRVHLRNLAEEAGTHADPVGDGGFAGSVEGGRLAKTGDTPSSVTKAIHDALQREEEEEVSVQRLELTGLYLLASQALDNDDGQQDQPEVAVKQGGDECSGEQSGSNQGGDADGRDRLGPARRHVAEAGVAVEGDPGLELSDEDRQRAGEEVAALTSTEGIHDLIRRFVKAGAPIAEDGGSGEDVEAFAEVFADACFVAEWLTQQKSIRELQGERGEGNG